MRTLSLFVCIAALSLSTMAGCDQTEPLSSGANVGVDEASSLMSFPFSPGSTPPPPGLVTVALGTETLEFWPYTGENFSGQGQDPINLIFFGNADPRSIRAALLSVNGDRTAFGWPDEPPFNGEWQDAIGNIQTGYGSETGWTGGAIQLACGDYHVARFHLRLFRLGNWTVGNAHFEVLIPGTSDHQVLSWEFAEQFVITDMLRSGLLDTQLPMMPTQAINPSPFRTIPSVIYNGLPVPLRAAIGGPTENVDYDVPMGTDGHAMIFNVAGSQPLVPGIEVENSVSVFDQVIPKPFCVGSQDAYVYVTGSVALNQTNEMTPVGEFISTFRAEGELFVTPVNPTTGQPIGETSRALVREHHDAYLSDNVVNTSSMQHQMILPPSAEGGGSLLVRLRVNSGGANGYQVIIKCGDNPAAEANDPMGSSLLDSQVRR